MKRLIYILFIIAYTSAMCFAQQLAQQKDNQAPDQVLHLFSQNNEKYKIARRNLYAILDTEPQFWTELQAVAARLKTQPEWILNVVAAESLFNPGAHNPMPGQTASGLLQIIDSTAKGLGTTSSAIRKMKPIEQLQYIEKYFEPFVGQLNSLADVYTAVFRGKVILGGDDEVIVDATKEPHIYALNASLDINRDRYIMKGELALAALAIGRFVPANTMLVTRSIKSKTIRAQNIHETQTREQVKYDNSEPTRTKSIFIRHHNSTTP